jgi:RNA polymerase sigma factor (TIGR02999 family)
LFIFPGPELNSMPDPSAIPSNVEITQLLKAWGQGDEGALDKLTPLVHAELHRLAHHYMSQEKPGHMLQTTALVNEAYLRLVDITQVSWQDRAHFFAVSARMMRRILIDFARSRNYQKRGGAALHVSFDEAQARSREPDAEVLAIDDALAVSQAQNAEIVAIDEALVALAAIDARKSQVVELRFFGGLTVEETAEVLKVSPETVKRDWRFAKAWLHRVLSGEKDDDGGALAAS